MYSFPNLESVLCCMSELISEIAAKPSCGPGSGCSNCTNTPRWHLMLYSHLQPSSWVPWMGLRELCQNHVPFFFFFLVITASRNNAEKISFNWDFCLRISSFFTKVKRVALRCKIIADRLQSFLLNSFSLKPLASKLTSLKWWSILQGPVWLSLGLHFTSWLPLCGVGAGSELSAWRLKLLPLLEKTWTVPKKGKKGPSPGIPWQSSSNPHPTDFGRGSCVQPSFAAGVCSGPKALFCSVMWASWQPTPEAATGIGSKWLWRSCCLSSGIVPVYLLEELLCTLFPSPAPATALRIWFQLETTSTRSFKVTDRQYWSEASVKAASVTVAAR